MLDRLKVRFALMCLLLYVLFLSLINTCSLFQNMVSQHVECSRYSLADLLDGLLKYDPSERLTARQALNHPFFKHPFFKNPG